MSALLFPFMLLAGLGLLLSVASHVAALLGLQIPGGRLVWGLHVGIFVVWIPTVLVANIMARQGKRSDFWKLALSGCPNWARYALYGLFGYAVFNFVWSMVTTNVHTSEGGRAHLDGEVRLFSGHWMVFYGAAFAVLYSAIKRPESRKARKCVRGHDVSPLDQFCPVCGASLESAPAKV